MTARKMADGQFPPVLTLKTRLFDSIWVREGLESAPDVPSACTTSLSMMDQ